MSLFGNAAGKAGQQQAQVDVNTASGQQDNQTQQYLAQLQNIMAGMPATPQVNTPSIGAIQSPFANGGTPGGAIPVNQTTTGSPMNGGAGGMKNTGATAAPSSAPAPGGGPAGSNGGPVAGNWSAFPGRPNLEIETDPSNPKMQITYNKQTGKYNASNPYDGVFSGGASSIAGANGEFDQQYPQDDSTFKSAGSAAPPAPRSFPSSGMRATPTTRAANERNL